MASDIVQANCIVWVEGPSDRIYIRHWLQSLDFDLEEGIHYSIMFYGGRLLSHLTANDPDVEDFISLRRLNRYMAVVIDSDRRNSTARINDTKRRVRDELHAGPGFAWVTKGREIENYVEDNILLQAVASVERRAIKLGRTNEYSKPLTCVDARGKELQPPDKIKVARAVTSMAAHLDVLDLRKQITRLARFIQDANGATTGST